MSFDIELNGTMDFSRCKRFSVRGYNKAMLSTVVSTDVKSCVAFNPLLIVPNVIIDAFGDPEFDIGIHNKTRKTIKKNYIFNRSDRKILFQIKY